MGAHFFQSGGSVSNVKRASHSVVYKKDTRHAHFASISLDMADGRQVRVEIEPLYPFFMSGIGYNHPVWGHGTCHGCESCVHYDKYETELVDRMDPLFWHVQEVSKATVYVQDGGVPDKDCGASVVFNGIAAMEQLVVGRHDRSGFSRLADT